MQPATWLALLTLTALELVLGIDNVIFISTLVDKLPLHQREKARRIGLFLAMFMRIGLLFLLSWIVGLTAPIFSVLFQVILIDLVFSLDSIITAVGMVDEVAIMVAAVVLAVGLMMCFASAIGRFVSAHPTIKMLALSFLFVIGTVLVADGFGHHMPKGYIYSALAFSLLVEVLNMKYHYRRRAPVHLRDSYAAPPDDAAKD